MGRSGSGGSPAGAGIFCRTGQTTSKF
ncbi:unnamed protein product [Acanthoscelides obtectus]|uniref:Uncharacterized protein n=1 Tax=Acanthoscelides obtectus TaxID=200917 RepID=A0A9P0MKP3_ACAOB|nr:unnamed protein product [Acanthoscelides obtectus]CAH2014364.1 unnamed protein product [Acanthoscelides obtectus]CAH2018704.1 unnamed protein product [Acanthoscelides obtectus]CAH2021726.1 unnamed protein product [Acanthoscelides obtectus]CAK1623380.1 hypothetical protein AOBTE_LOCUS1967 [Acanthoscelides obtectus]